MKSNEIKHFNRFHLNKTGLSLHYKCFSESFNSSAIAVLQCLLAEIMIPQQCYCCQLAAKTTVGYDLLITKVQYFGAI